MRCCNMSQDEGSPPSPSIIRANPFTAACKNSSTEERNWHIQASWHLLLVTGNDWNLWKLQVSNAESERAARKACTLAKGWTGILQGRDSNKVQKTAGLSDIKNLGTFWVFFKRVHMLYAVESGRSGWLALLTFFHLYLSQLVPAGLLATFLSSVLTETV